MRKFTKIVQVLIVLSLLSACTTQKKKGDLSLLGKVYQNTTAKYNGYFNARELLNASTLTLEEQHQDNYNKVLNMYEYVAADNPQAVAGDLDEAIKKVTVVVNLHPQSHWVDDCYLLAGKAQFLKQDYEAAEETLRFMVDEFSPASMAKKAKERAKNSDKKSSKKKKGGKRKKKSSDAKEKKKRKKEAERKRKKYNRDVKKGKKKSSSKKKNSDKKKKEEEDKDANSKKNEKIAKDNKKKSTEPVKEPYITSVRLSDNQAAPTDESDSYFMKHRPVYQEGVLWLAKTLLERDNYESANRYMAQLDQNPKTFKHIRKDLAGLQAYSFLKRKDYAQAVANLEKAVELSDSRKEKARFTYIKAQIHQKQGQEEEAYASFEKVVKYSQDYEMTFSSKLNMAQNAWLSGKGSAEDAKRNMEKMLKDSKNQEFKDQIYFALAKIDLRNGDRQAAIVNLEKSLQFSSGNKAQKAEAYLRLARLYFEVEDYVPSKHYYDSTLLVISPTDERYPEVKKFSTDLQDIAQHIETITLQDSLLRLSELSDEEKKAFAFRLKKEEDERRRQELQKKANAQANPSRAGGALTARRGASRAIGARTGSSALQKESNFFAYNDRNLKRGRRDFLKKWGGRTLEDNWRRSNRRSTTDLDENLEEEVVASSILTDEEVDRILKDVPKSKGDIAKSKLLIQESMFALGALYRERLENYKKSITTLESLNERFPTNNRRLDAWYYLYLSNTDINNPTRAQFYYDKIIKEFPQSTYAKLLKDPSYADQLLDEEKQLNVYYDNAFLAFNRGEYKKAYDQSSQAKIKFGATNPLQARFALLSAMCIGNIQGKDAYMKALREVIARYPQTDEQKRAREILRFLGDARAALPGDEKESKSNFKLEDQKLHYIIISFNGETKLEDQKARVSDYNRAYHKLDKLRISNIYLGPTADSRLPIIVIRRFKNRAAAMKYYDGVQKNKADFIDRNMDYDIFAITQGNYRQVLKSKSLAGYKSFFEKNYLD